MHKLQGVQPGSEQILSLQSGLYKGSAYLFFFSATTNVTEKNIVSTIARAVWWYCLEEPSTKTECDYLFGWIKNGHKCKILPKMVNPRDVAGNAEEEEKGEEDEEEEEKGEEEEEKKKEGEERRRRRGKRRRRKIGSMEVHIRQTFKELGIHCGRQRNERDGGRCVCWLVA